MEKAIFDQRLQRAAAKCWLKYSTGIVCRGGLWDPKGLETLLTIKSDKRGVFGSLLSQVASLIIVKRESVPHSSTHRTLPIFLSTVITRCSSILQIKVDTEYSMTLRAKTTEPHPMTKMQLMVRLNLTFSELEVHHPS